MRPRNLFVLFVALSAFWACQKDSDTTRSLDAQLEAALEKASNGQGIGSFMMPQSDDLANIPQDPKNPLTPAKVELGKLLYHETGLALAPMREIGKGTFSCASCHFASAGFQAGRHQGLSEGGVGFGTNGEGREVLAEYPEMELDVQPIRTPSAMNGAYQELMLWNGQFGATGENIGTEDQWQTGTPKVDNVLGYEGLETQAIAGLKVHRLIDNEEFLMNSQYRDMFAAAFPDLFEHQRFNREHVGRAIAAYERTLLANEAPFQRWLRGDQMAMTDAEKRGAVLFFDKAECGTCHNGPALNVMEFHAIGMNDLHECGLPVFRTPSDDPAILGRGGFTKREEDMFKFKVPQLYNLADSPFYGHGSSFVTVREVVAYKNAAIPENPTVPESQLSPAFKPLNLTESEIDDITAFLETALRDPNLERYVPESLPSGQCFPNNDPLSQMDLGCN